MAAAVTNFISDIKSAGIPLKNVRVDVAVQVSNLMPSNHLDKCNYNLFAKGQLILVEDIKTGHKIIVPMSNVVFYTPSQD